MREILFKAKRIDNGEWVEGSLIDLDIDSGYCYIVPPYKKASILPINFLITGLACETAVQGWNRSILHLRHSK